MCTLQFAAGTSERMKCTGCIIVKGFDIIS